MKLYTEEQVRKAIKMADKYHYLLDSEESEIVNILESIELPSDEEIENYSRQSGLVHPFVSRGAKWMRNKIQGGNNEQQ